MATTQISKDGVVIGVGLVEWAAQGQAVLSRVMLYLPAIDVRDSDPAQILEGVCFGEDLDVKFALRAPGSSATVTEDKTTMMLERCEFLEIEAASAERHAIRGIAATICQGRPRETLTEEQRRFINEVVAPEIYYQRTTIFMHMYPRHDLPGR